MQSNVTTRVGSLEHTYKKEQFILLSCLLSVICTSWHKCIQVVKTHLKVEINTTRIGNNQNSDNIRNYLILFHCKIVRIVAVQLLLKDKPFKTHLSWTQWHMPVILALGRQSHVDVSDMRPTWSKLSSTIGMSIRVILSFLPPKNMFQIMEIFLI